MSYNKNNIFAKIIRGEIPTKKIYEDEKVLAFNDISQAAPVHVLVIPKGDYIDFTDFTNKADATEISYFFKKTAEIAELLNLRESGFRTIFNSGSNAHQTVPHFHVHLLGGRKLGPLLQTDNQLR